MIYVLGAFAAKRAEAPLTRDGSGVRQGMRIDLHLLRGYPLNMMERFDQGLQIIRLLPQRRAFQSDPCCILKSSQVK